MLSQFIYTAVALLPAFPCDRSFLLNSLTVFAIFCVAAYNGGEYYIEVFSRRYHRQFTKGAAREVAATAATAAAAVAPSAASDDDDDFAYLDAQPPPRVVAAAPLVAAARTPQTSTSGSGGGGSLESRCLLSPWSPAFGPAPENPAPQPPPLVSDSEGAGGEDDEEDACNEGASEHVADAGRASPGGVAESEANGAVEVLLCRREQSGVRRRAPWSSERGGIEA